MTDVVPPAPSERGWGKLLLALAAFLFLPWMPPLRALLPVEETLLLLLPALAACCLVGWWAGGRMFLALAWVGLAGWALAQPAVPGSFYNLVRGWSLLFAGAFGLVCLFGNHRPFFSRALATLSLSLVLVLVMSSRGPLTPSRARQEMQAEFARRNAASVALFRRVVKENPDAVKAMPELASFPENMEKALGITAEAGAKLFPSMLLLESLIALALAWATFHRLSRTRLGAPLGPLKDFRFNDQLVWGLIAGLAIVFVPTLDFLGATGSNLLVFFGALYAIRGFGVLSWFMKPGALAVTSLIGVAILFVPVLNTMAVLGFMLLALAAFGLGLGDTWADWRRRTRPTT
ncbi:MAG: Protein of unknown function rane [Gemmatimonadetes bacterium]|nr:Protein of unknown function rane [Gemmatimonadota bacterium]